MSDAGWVRPPSRGRAHRVLLLAIITLSPLLLTGTSQVAARGRIQYATTMRSFFVPVLIYHHVKVLRPSDDAIERGLTVLPSQFGAELDYLARNHYQPIPAARLIEALQGHGTLPSKPLVLTFDDGYTDVYGNVYQVLRRRGMTATFFIVPGFLDTPRYLSWKQVIDMSRHGMDIEAHSLTHPDLTTLSPARLAQEVAGSRHVLQQQLHRTVRVFAYPYGAFDGPVLTAVSRAGFAAAFTTHQGWRQRSDSLLQLPRVYVDLDDTLQIYAGRLRADPAVLAQDPT